MFATVNLKSWELGVLNGAKYFLATTVVIVAQYYVDVLNKITPVSTIQASVITLGVFALSTVAHWIQAHLALKAQLKAQATVTPPATP